MRFGTMPDLVIFFDEGRYDGHLWFSTLPQTQSSDPVKGEISTQRRPWNIRAADTAALPGFGF